MATTGSRRDFLRNSALTAALAGAGCAAVETQGRAEQLIDTHTHFYDPARPQGVPWPGKGDALLYRTVLPPHYRALTQPRRVTGTVVVEASPWLEDNQWVLDLASRDPFIVGLVGNLPEDSATFRTGLKRFASNPLFRGIRIVHPRAVKTLADKSMLADLALLMDHDLELDLNGGPALLADADRLAAALPGLRIVINHVANVKIDGKSPPADWLRGMDACARHKNVFSKVSALVEGTGRSDGTAPSDVAFYRPVLDAVWERFGGRRLIYGSNWPVSERFASCAVVQGIVLDYFNTKGPDARERFFSENSRAAYKWIQRKA
jgi:L-fuconolactonase